MLQDVDFSTNPAQLEPDTLARLLDEQLWRVQRLGIRDAIGSQVPVLTAVADQLESGAIAEARIRALLISTLNDAGRGVPEYEAARVWYGLTDETAGHSDLDRHITAFQLLNELRHDHISYDAFRTRVSLTINRDISYRIMLRYRHATALRQRQPVITNAAQHLDTVAARASLWTGPRLKHETLPAAQWFVGRAGLLSDLTAYYDALPLEEPPVAVITGTGGMGKTSLALRWAHLHSDQFPDGRLYIDLRGFHPSMQPLPTAEALRVLLDALGVDPKGRPTTFNGQLAIYRELTASRRVLLVADNARDAAQVVPLLPSGMQCMTIITSRNQLSGLTSRRPKLIEVDRLSNIEARQLLCGYLSDERVKNESEAIDAIIGHCGGMALALAIVAGRARKRPDFPLEMFAQELGNAAARLDLLDTADPSTSIRAIMSWSYPLLSTDAAMAFRLVATADGVSMSIGSICALMGWNERQTDRALRALEDASLIRQVSPGRFDMHDLVRLYAIERGHEIDAHNFREAAGRRLVSYYLHSSYAADRLLAEFRRSIDLPTLDDGVIAEHPVDESEALAWLADEYQNLVEAQRAAAKREWVEQVWAFAWTLDNYRWRSGLIRDDINAWQLGLEAATQISLFARGLAHRRLGRAHGRAGDWSLALYHIRRAIDIADEAGDEPGAAHGLRILSWLCERTGDEEASMEAAQESYRRYFSIGNPVWTAHSLSVLGDCYSRVSDEMSARDCWEHALVLHREYGHDTGEAETLLAIGASEQAHDPEAALTFLREASDIYGRIKDTYNQAGALEQLGVSLGMLGRATEARSHWTQALILYREHGRDSDVERVMTRLSDSGDDAPGDQMGGK
jgi:tetratricopeptide (TPR) repeat protein